MKAKIDIRKALQIIQPNGALESSLKGFQPRIQQQKMMENIIEAYNNDSISLIEAGTGTGKSIAYLIPALLWAAEFKERTVISTHTITLQEQLIKKDIPLLIKALNLDLKAVLVKGMSNYLCMRKFLEMKQELRLLPIQEAEELEKMEKWKESTYEGSRSTLPFVPSSELWERVCAESDTCNHQDCPFYQQCYFFKARRQAIDAQIVVVNHSLLLIDLVRRGEQEGSKKNVGILPPYDRLILDEAHHIEDVATENFGMRLSQLGMLRSLSRLTSEKQSKNFGKLPLLKEKISEHYRHNIPEGARALFKRLTIDFSGQRQDLVKQTADTFQYYSGFVDSLQKDGGNRKYGETEQLSGESKQRLLPMHKTHPIWQERIIPATKQLCTSLDRYVQDLNSVEKDVKALNNEPLAEQTKSICFDIQALANRLSDASVTLHHFIDENVPANSVRWVESSKRHSKENTCLVDVELEVSKKLAHLLFKNKPTVILCSATLTTNRQFRYIRKRLGLTEELCPDRIITEHLYDSPFDYQKQALFLIPKDLPDPQNMQFLEKAMDAIWNALQACQGGAFVLFTSYQMLRLCAEQLSKRLSDHRFVVFKQGDDNRHSLLHRFKSTPRAVLFGTDSFWEGVDVAGDALRCVILVKLPFKVPSEPIIQARTEAIVSTGGDPFFEYSLPMAIVKFKQGIGRLIRNKTDRGCIVCLDTRLIHKNYGQLFLNSLPPFEKTFVENAFLSQQMSDFYRSSGRPIKI